MKGNRDQLDLYCEEWAQQRRIIMGITLGEKLQPKDRLGKIRCTLGKMRDEGLGASQNRTVNENGHYNQNFPEVYTGMALLIHRGFCSMPGDRREVMDLHYVWREISVKVKAESIDISPKQFWILVGLAREYLYGFLQIPRGERKTGVCTEYKHIPVSLAALRNDVKRA